MHPVLRFSIAFPLTYDIFSNLFAYTNTPLFALRGYCRVERDDSVSSYPNQPESILGDREEVL